MTKNFNLFHGDNMESLKKLEDNSIDSIVSDPPYGLSFMNKKWDYDVPSVEFWKEVYRVLKPGGHILSFGGTRTYHRMVVNIEDAGFEIRDQIQWIYGSGFPKSHNIGKAVDKLKGNERKDLGKNPASRPCSDKGDYETNTKWKTPPRPNITKGQSEWEGWGTALKPANEPICLARKPLSEKSISENVLKWGTGGINVDGCRIGSESIETIHNPKITGKMGQAHGEQTGYIQGENSIHEGRFPANIILECICDSKGDIHTNPNCPCRLMDEQSGISKRGIEKVNEKYPSINNGSKVGMKGIIVSNYPGKGGASRFFYQAKVSKGERNMGLDGFQEKQIEMIGQLNNSIRDNGTIRTTPDAKKNHHPTIKPVNLMAYLCRLITPPNGTILDPFMGSGSTGIAALLEGFNFIGMEMDDDYMKIAIARIQNYEKYRKFIK